MHSGEMLVVIPKVVFAELRSCVALLLQEVSDCRRPVRNSVRGPREADGKQSSSEWVLPQNERRTARSTALLSIGVSEERSLFRQAVDVGGSFSPHPDVVGADIPEADVVPPNNEAVRLLLVPETRGSPSQAQNWEDSRQ